MQWEMESAQPDPCGGISCQVLPPSFFFLLVDTVCHQSSTVIELVLERKSTLRACRHNSRTLRSKLWLESELFICYDDYFVCFAFGHDFVGAFQRMATWCFFFGTSNFAPLLKLMFPFRLLEECFVCKQPLPLLKRLDWL